MLGLFTLTETKFFSCNDILRKWESTLAMIHQIQDHKLKIKRHQVPKAPRPVDQSFPEYQAWDLFVFWNKDKIKKLNRAGVIYIHNGYAYHFFHLQEDNSTHIHNTVLHSVHGCCLRIKQMGITHVKLHFKKGFLLGSSFRNFHYTKEALMADISNIAESNNIIIMPDAHHIDFNFLLCNLPILSFYATNS